MLHWGMELEKKLMVTYFGKRYPHYEMETRAYAGEFHAGSPRDFLSQFRFPEDTLENVFGIKPSLDLVMEVLTIRLYTSISGVKPKTLNDKLVIDSVEAIKKGGETAYRMHLVYDLPGGSGVRAQMGIWDCVLKEATPSYSINLVLTEEEFRKFSTSGYNSKLMDFELITGDKSENPTKPKIKSLVEAK